MLPTFQSAVALLERLLIAKADAQQRHDDALKADSPRHPRCSRDMDALTRRFLCRAPTPSGNSCRAF